MRLSIWLTLLSGHMQNFVYICLTALQAVVHSISVQLQGRHAANGVR